MLRHTRLSIISILCLFSLRPALCQDGTSRNYIHEFSGIGIHGGIGWSFFGKGTTNNYNTWVFLPNGGIHTRWFFSPNIGVFHSLDYLSVGAKNKATYSIDENRLRTIQLSNYLDIFLTQSTQKPVVLIRGGFFVGRILESLHYWERLDLDIKGRNTPINTFGNWNAGITAGVEVSQKVKTDNLLSAALHYDLGIKNVLIANLPDGINTYTRAYRITLSYTFH